MSFSLATIANQFYPTQKCLLLMSASVELDVLKVIPNIKQYFMRLYRSHQNTNNYVISNPERISVQSLGDMGFFI